MFSVSKIVLARMDLGSIPMLVMMMMLVELVVLGVMKSGNRGRTVRVMMMFGGGLGVDFRSRGVK